MISKEKDKFLYEYNKPIIWNVSGFGNESNMFTLDNMLEILKKYNFKIPISTLHGSYSCKYNGGRSAIFKSSRTNIENKIKYYNDLGIGIKLTFSNMNIHKDTFEEEEMRWYLDILNERKDIGNGIICVNDDFAELVKKNYPDLDLVASHVKMELETKMGISDTSDYYNSKFDLYDIVVVNTYRAFDDDFLSKITHPEKIEFIVNRSCSTNCQVSNYHHQLIDKLQELKVKYNNDQKKLQMSREYIDTKKKVSDLLIKCQKIKAQNDYEKIRRQFINREEINYLANTYNITKFKIEGRDLSTYEFIINMGKYFFNRESFYDIVQIEGIDEKTQDIQEFLKLKFID